MEILEQNAAYVVCVKPAGIPSQGEGAGGHASAAGSGAARIVSAAGSASASAAGSGAERIASGAVIGAAWRNLSGAPGSIRRSAGVMGLRPDEAGGAALSRAIQEGRWEKDTSLC